MAYGLSTRMHLANEAVTPRPRPPNHIAAAHAVLWNELREDQRLALVERNLKTGRLATAKKGKHHA